jgi:hypothetical protein
MALSRVLGADVIVCLVASSSRTMPPRRPARWR